MKRLNQLTATSVLVVLLLFIGLDVSAQQTKVKADDFTDEEYEKFANVNVELIPVQQEVQGKMMQAIADEGLEAQRFQELAQAQQQGKISEASDDPEEIAKFSKAGQKVMAIQKEVQSKAQSLIGENELSIQKFQQMSMAYNQSQEVKAKVDALISKKMEKDKD